MFTECLIPSVPCYFTVFVASVLFSPTGLNWMYAEMLCAPTTYKGIPGAEYCQMAAITVPSVFPTITKREGAD